MTYDVRNRSAQETFPEGEGTLDLTYDAKGNVIRRLYSDGLDLSYTYDPIRRLLTAEGLNLTYDAMGRITDSNGIAVARYPGGRLIRL